MSTVCELAFSAQRAAEMTELITGSIRYWQDLPELETLDLYTPAAASGADPYVDDGPAPACLALLAFPSFEALDRAAHHARFKTGLRVLGTDVLTCTAMQRSEHAAAGTERPAPLTAQFSYVVRYHRPAEDEAAFVRHYLDTHPSLLARLPRIRNVLCYVPLAWRHPAGIPIAEYILGNEVIFDHGEDFNAAMASPLRHELRAHFRQFPPFSGRNTHYPMQRRRLFP
jgi:uncharacterized protein (TIGR02118 family)